MTVPPAPWLAESSVWQLVECCSYTADLPAWDRLAAGASTPVLDLGCGIGRVAHHLGRAGHPVTGIDSDPGVVADFNRDSPGPDIRAEVGDATGLGLPERRFDRIFAPQQLIQVIGDEESRSRLLRAAAGRLTPDGTLALALTTSLPERSVELVVLPDVREVGGWVYSSRPSAIEAEPDAVEIVRERQRVSPAGDLLTTEDRIRFRRLTPDRLEGELAEAGLLPGETVEVPATDAHVGSVIVTARPDPERL